MNDDFTPRSVIFRVDWEPDPEELRAVRDYLVVSPGWAEDSTIEDHCEGLAAGILQTLHVLAAKRAGTDPARPPGRELTEPERQRYIAQARRLGQHVERLRAEIAEMEKDAHASWRIFSMDSPIRHSPGGVWHEHDPAGCASCAVRCALTHITAYHYGLDS